MPPYVHKLRVPVTLSQLNREARDGWFLVTIGSNAGDRSESVLELLNSRVVVIPFLPQHDPNVVLVTRQHIEWIGVSATVDAALVAPPDRNVTREQRVELRFMDQRHLDGIIQWNGSGDHGRLSDFLNGPDDFFLLKTSAGPFLVNRLRLAETRVAESSPRPAATEPHDTERAIPPFKMPTQTA
jgi:hypothetical protein